ncbi:MAG: SDR family NAD(P)-dependent oxidoreductase [Cyanobacteria bacterium P01_D01_bin.105]
MTKLQRAIVTGATSGIGAATVKAFSTSGYEVLAVARRADRLAKLADEFKVQTLVADVRDIATLTAAIQDFKPDILVNNAGVGHGIDGLPQLAPALMQEAVDINVTAPIQLTAAVIPGMKERGRGHIVNIGSIAGLHTLVSSLYGSTKAAVHTFSQNLRVELLGSGLRVSEICPGRVTSEFYQSAKGDRQRLDAMNNSGIRELTPNDIAAAVLYAVDAPAHVNVATIELLPTDQAVGGVKAQSSVK